MTVKPKPEGFHTATPYLSINGATRAIEFYIRAFGAVESYRMLTPDGRIGHAEIRIGDSPIMLADDCGAGEFRSPLALNGSSVGLYVYVDDVDSQFERAVKEGAKVISPVQDQFYGDRSCSLEDPFGHVWFFATHKEDLSMEEINHRAEILFRQDQAG